MVTLIYLMKWNLENVVEPVQKLENQKLDGPAKQQQDKKYTALKKMNSSSKPISEV